MKLTRTQIAFQQALFILLKNNPFSELTIEDICDTAQRHRSSFYRYYNDKEDLLRSVAEVTIHKLIDSATTLEDGINRIITYISENKIYFMNLLSDDKASSGLYLKLNKILVSIMLKRHEDNVEDPLIIMLGSFKDPKLSMTLFAGSLIGALYYWKECDFNWEREEITAHTHKLIDHLLAHSHE